MEEKNKIEIEIEKLEKESEEFLKEIDMNNMSDADVEKVQGTIEEMFERIKKILEESNKQNQEEETETDLDLE